MELWINRDQINHARPVNIITIILIPVRVFLLVHNGLGWEVSTYRFYIIASYTYFTLGHSLLFTNWCSPSCGLLAIFINPQKSGKLRLFVVSKDDRISQYWYKNTRCVLWLLHY